MSGITARRVVLAGRPSGWPTLDNFRLERFTPPPVPAGGLLLRARYLSLDPYMRMRMDEHSHYAGSVGLGETMHGQAVAEVLQSEHPDYAEGDTVLAPTGWASHAVSDGTGLRKLDPTLAPTTTGLGVLGMPGFTAYSGLMVIGKPKPGETVVVTSASGPVGSVVGQLAKITGCRTVGIAGGADKCRYLREELGFDAAVDHHAPDFAEQLAAACPAGVDVHFENVGGAVWQAVLPLFNRFARVPLCGLITQYNGGSQAADGELAETMQVVLTKNMTLRGFFNTEFVEEHFSEFLRVVSDGIADGRIKYREDVTEGLEHAPEAFLRMLRGQNLGKVLVKVGE
ncbi:MAG: NADP-dependent oxidoreductase [Amycolatopsis sp.]|uniref:NADP-dependent oxidoreductase n=1 Tax=Amycolatopsis sp. TaxID=37632 RepID=UPI0026356660|nr:NADP-dependent oxidoreductase [Amycolatopsis sp.]MCU1681948.1 NADP-dependent oxidoreductase [Amycolatopsis sp.]